MSQATHSKIVLEASNDLVGEFLLRNDSDPHQFLSLEEIEPVFYRCKELNSPTSKTSLPPLSVSVG